MIQFAQAVGCVLLGFMLVMIGMSPGLLQGVADAMNALTSHFIPAYLRPQRAQILSQPSWWLVAIGAAFVAVTLVVFFA